MSLVICYQCHTRVLPGADGTCPSCRKFTAQTAPDDFSWVTNPSYQDSSNLIDSLAEPPQKSNVVNPYAAPTASLNRLKKPPRQLDSQFWRGVGCILAGVLLSAIGVNFFLYGVGVMPMFIIGGGPILFFVGLSYIYFWYCD